MDGWIGEGEREGWTGEVKKDGVGATGWGGGQRKRGRTAGGGEAKDLSAISARAARLAG